PPTPTTDALTLHDALPISPRRKETLPGRHRKAYRLASLLHFPCRKWPHCSGHRNTGEAGTRSRVPTLSTLLRRRRAARIAESPQDRKSTRLNSSHQIISYA